MAETLSPTPTTPKGGGSMAPLMTQSIQGKTKKTKPKK